MGRSNLTLRRGRSCECPLVRRIFSGNAPEVVLWRLFSVFFWQTTWYFKRAVFLSFLYWVLIWVGWSGRCSLLSAAFPIELQAFIFPFLLLNSPALIFAASNLTLSCLEEGIKKCSYVLSREVNNSTLDNMLAVECGLLLSWKKACLQE